MVEERTMPQSTKRPCCVCGRWFRSDPRIGHRQRTCKDSSCQTARRRKKQAAWRARNPDYFRARRLQARDAGERTAKPLKVPPPLSKLPWDIAQDEFGVKGADFIGIFGTVLLRAAQDQFRAYPIESTELADTLNR